MLIYRHVAAACLLAGLSGVACGQSAAPQAFQEAVGAPASGLRFVGSYVAGRQYAPSDVVTFGGSAYVANQQSKNIAPSGGVASGTTWKLLASGAAPGSEPVHGAPADMGTTSTNVALEDVIFGADNAIPTGDRDSVFGVGAGANLTSGREMTIIGANACGSFTGDPVAAAAGSPENGLTTCIGSDAGASMVSTGPSPSIDNVFVGQKAAENATTIAADTIVGVHAGTAISTGEGDVVVGAHAMDGDTQSVSDHNTIVGNYSTLGIGDKHFNTIVGALAAGHLGASTGLVSVGSFVESATTAENAVIIGSNAAANATDLAYNVVIGAEAAPNAPSSSVIVGAFSASNATVPITAIGFGAATSATNGPYNTCVGFYSCGSMAGGDHDTSVGSFSGHQMQGTESFNEAFGADASTAAGVNFAAQIGSGTNNTSGSLQFNNTQVVDGNGDLHAGTTAPASNSTCTPGAFRVVMPYVYACVAQNQWMRAELSTY